MKLANYLVIICIALAVICFKYGESQNGNGNGNGIDNGNDDDYNNNAPDVNEVTPPKINERLRPPSCGVVVLPCDPNEKFRRFDGSCNNLIHPEWGLPNSTYSRLLPAKYSDGMKTPRRATDQSQLTGAREIRVKLFPTGSALNTLWNVHIMTYGQFLAHDMSLHRQPEKQFACCPPRGEFKKGNGGSKYCFPMKVNKDDPTQGSAGIRCINFTRSMTDRDMGCTRGNIPSNQINVVTPYLDLSNVYGNDKFTADSLRSFVGGQMKVEIRNNRVYPPTETNLNAFCKCNLPDETACYASGDSRTNQNPHLVILQTLFVREHNRLANALAALNPHWDDERLFQEARRINIAEYQQIAYYEWNPILFKRPNLLAAGAIYNTNTFVNDYNPNVSPDISNEHAHAAFRHFHTQIIAQFLSLMGPDRSTISETTMTEWINRPSILEKGFFMEQFTVGLVTQPTGQTDSLFDPLISDKLFACRNEGFGTDLKAADIQRDRDHALDYYNNYRTTRANSFDDFTDLISPENVAILKTLYKSHEDVDLSVGGALETVITTGPQVGPTFLNIILEQFRRTRQSDRFWFENESSGLTLEQLTEIRKATISRFMCDNADGITQIQPRGFNLIRNTNVLGPCDALPSMDLTKWVETVSFAF